MIEAMDQQWTLTLTNGEVSAVVLLTHPWLQTIDSDDRVARVIDVLFEGVCREYARKSFPRGSAGYERELASLLGASLAPRRAAQEETTV